MNNIEIKGLDKLQLALRQLPEELRPIVLRDIARKPAQQAAKIARDLQPIGATGATARTIGILRVRNPKFSFVEVGYRGRSLGHIYTSALRIVRRLRGFVAGFPWLFKRSGERMQSTARAELKVDFSRVVGRYFRRKGYRSKI